MEVKDAAVLGIDASTVGSGAALTNVVKMEPPAERTAGKMIQGDAAQMVQELVRVLKDEAKVL